MWLGGGGSTEGPGSSVAGGRGGKHVHCHLLGSGIISTGTAACIFHQTMLYRKTYGLYGPS